MTYVFLGFYVLAGLLCVTAMTYSLTDPTTNGPNDRDAFNVLVAGVLWPLWLVVLGFLMLLDVVWQRRRDRYYGKRP